MGVFSYVSGALFAASWWVFVDGLVVARPHTYVFAMWVPGILGTLCFIMANMTTPGAMMSGGLFDEGNVQKHKVWFFFSILIGFGALIAAVWIMVDNPRIKDQSWPGASLIVQAFGLVAAALIFFFGRKKKSDDIM